MPVTSGAAEKETTDTEEEEKEEGGGAMLLLGDGLLSGVAVRISNRFEGKAGGRTIPCAGEEEVVSISTARTSIVFERGRSKRVGESERMGDKSSEDVTL